MFSSTLLGQNQKLAQTGMKFLNVGAGAQQTAMGEAVTSLEGSSLSMFYNPAAMARLSSLYDVTLGQTRWIADINHNYASVAINPSNGDYGVIGFTMQFVDYGDLQETIRSNNQQGFLDVGTFRPTASAIGIGYARALSDRFSVGGNVKYVTQNLGNAATLLDSYGNSTRTKSSKDVMVFDFGMLYKTGFKSLNFGVAIRNFSQEVKYEREGFQLPLIFKIGVSMNAVDFTDLDNKMHSLLFSVDATHPRDYPEQVNLGAEYLFMQILAMRGGYMSNNDEYGWTYGLGVQKAFGEVKLGFDYSYTPFGVFTEVSRISVTLTMLR
jgi:hypothetical protein